MSTYGPVVITGASGMIGAPLARRCVADGVEVHVLTRSGSVPTRLAPLVGRARIHRVLWEEPQALRELLNTIAPRTIFHLAAARLTMPAPSLGAHLASAVAVAAQLLTALRNRPETSIVYASSGAVYGARTGATESVCVEPASWLGATKAMAEDLLAAEARMHGRSLVILRLFTPFGPDEDPDRLIQVVLRAAADGSSLALTTGSQTRDYIFIEDVVDAFIRSAWYRPERPAVFNVGSGQMRSVRSVVESILARFNRGDLAQFGARADRLGEITAMEANVSHALDCLGWAPRLTFDEGIDRTIACWVGLYGHKERTAERERVGVQ